MTAGSEKDEYDGDAADDVAIAGCGPLSPPPSIVDPGYLSIRMLFVSLLTFCKRTPKHLTCCRPAAAVPPSLRWAERFAEAHGDWNPRVGGGGGKKKKKKKSKKEL